MASSVLSEQAFLQGGITISKHHNHLQGDIIEALQCVKCAICHDLIFCEPGPSSVNKPEEDKSEADPNKMASDNDEGKEGWDALLFGDEEDEIESDFNM